MGKGQPYRADLLPAWRKVVDDASRDDEMRLRVVMAENEAGAEEHRPCGDAGERRRGGQQPRKAPLDCRSERYNHVSATQNIANR